LSPIPDSGASAHFFPLEGAPVHSVEALTVPLPISTPDGSIIHATHTGTLSYPNVPAAAQLTYLVPNLRSRPLLSIGVFCNAGCEVHFTRESIAITNGTRPILTGQRDHVTNLWSIAPAPMPPVALSLTTHRVTASDRVAFAHASLFSPAISTLTIALQKGYLAGIPGLTSDTLKQFPPNNSLPMHKGHLDQSRKNQRSTTNAAPRDVTIDDYFPSITEENTSDRTHLVCATIFQPTGKFYSDMTGKFVSPSSTGNNYILIVYDYDSNSIQAIPMRTRSKTDHLKALKTAYDALVHSGCRQLHQYPQPTQRAPSEVSN
jgi:hypothetical protein